MHPDLFVVDGHADTLYRALRRGKRWEEPDAESQTDLPRFVRGGVNLQVFALFSDPAHRGVGFAVRALEMINAFFRGIEGARENPALASSLSGIGCVLRKGDVERARGGFWGLLSIEGGEAIGGSVDALEAYFRFGVRAMGLVWNHRNELADGVAEAESGGGLTRLGREVVRRMNEWGMLVDVSHLSETGFWDVVRCAKAPIYASHSNARRLCNHPRNLTDDQLKAVADSGGVVGINFCDYFLVDSGDANVDHVIDHIAYISDLVGIEHVGLGTDYDGIETPPVGLEDVSKLPRLHGALEERGFDESAIRAVLGENLARLYQAVLPA